MKGLKTGGRKKGTPNQVTSDVRKRYKDFIIANFEEFVISWKNIVDPKDKVTTYINASKFVVPALQNVNLQSDDNADKTIEQQLMELSIEKNNDNDTCKL